MAARENEHYDEAIDDAKLAKRIAYDIFRTGTGAIMHPLQVTKTLVQLGYEPFPIQKGKSYVFFGPEKRYLPNFFEYTKRTYQTYGVSTIYRGVGAAIAGNIFGTAATVFVEQRLAKYYGLGDNYENEVPATDALADSRKFVRKIVRGSLSTVAGVVVARPFNVVMIRMIAQHIGGEEYYTGVFSGLRQIYNDEGLPGLFSGLLPQIAWELCVFWTIQSVTYAIEYLWKSYTEDEARGVELDEEPPNQVVPGGFKAASNFLVPLVVNSIFYPLQLTSTIMAVNGAPLLAGMPPFIPVYPTWQDCFHDLSAKNQLKRGAKTFFRFYDKPITYRYGDVYALPNA